MNTYKIIGLANLVLGIIGIIPSVILTVAFIVQIKSIVLTLLATKRPFNSEFLFVGFHMIYVFLVILSIYFGKKLRNESTMQKDLYLILSTIVIVGLLLMGTIGGSLFSAIIYFVAVVSPSSLP